MDSPSNLNNATHRKSRFTHRFLRALVLIHSLSPRDSNSLSQSSSSSGELVLQRYRRVKLAAYASMAMAIGRRRVWSQALLHMIQHRRCPSSIRPDQMPPSMKTIRGNKTKKRKKICPEQPEVQVIKKLQKLIPGGESMMNIEALLHETSHYVKCLAAQVQAMRNIADFYSCP